MEDDTAPRPRRGKLLTALLVVGAIAAIPVGVALAANSGSGGSSSGGSGAYDNSGAPAQGVANPGRDHRNCPKHHGQNQQNQQNQQDFQGPQAPTTEL
jgi:hypothetical protein